jgi:hypothetical protein
LTHAELVKVAARWLRNRKRCGVVLTEHHGGTLEIPDAIGFVGGFWAVQVECKVSVADYKADAKKPGRRFDGTTGEYRLAPERWYLTPPHLVRADTLPTGWGLLEWDGKRVAVRVQAEKHEQTPHVLCNQVTRLYMELRRYQAQGIRYLTVAEMDKQPPRQPLQSTPERP